MRTPIKRKVPFQSDLICQFSSTSIIERRLPDSQVHMSRNQGYEHTCEKLRKVS
jgi:hypothetical protein